MRETESGYKDTIAGISTAVGGAISVVRMSGADSLLVLRKVFRHKESDFESHKIYYGWIVEPQSGERVDEVLVSVMKAPKTFTREDVAEINCHGGALVVQKVLALLIKNGARLAEPGEFTKRAFLNGRLDLSKAEAVMDIINAKSKLAHRAAVRQLQGRLGHALNQTCDILLNLLAKIEMAIDYPEHDEANFLAKDIKVALKEIIDGFDALLATARQGRLIREGIKTAIVGAPNVGKSSLLNALVQEERAIVTDVPGTTRDVVRETIKLGGVFLEIADTAGIRDTNDIVEIHGVRRSHAEAQAADLVLLVVDGSRPVCESQIKPFTAMENVIAVVNKTDLPTLADKSILERAFGRVVEISAKNHLGIENLADTIQEMFFLGTLEYQGEIVTNTRHTAQIEAARGYLADALDALDGQMPVDLLSIDIYSAYAALGEILGIVVSDELIERIFSRFCLGK